MDIICKDCGKVLPSFKSLVTHIQFHHDKKIYYDNHMKNENEGFCKVCGKQTKFYSMGYGYYKFCSKECQANDIRINNKKLNFTKISKKKEETNMKRYGVRHNMQRKDIISQVKQTNLKKYGVENVFQDEKIKIKAKKKRQKTCLHQYGVQNYVQVESIREKIRRTWMNNYGVDNPLKAESVKEKVRQTCLIRYGTESSLQSESIKQKIRQSFLTRYGVDNSMKVESVKEKVRQTYLMRYGVDNPSKVPVFFEKMEKSSFKSALHTCGLYYRGSYEKDFLDIYANKLIILKGLSFKYNDGQKIRVYHSDYFIPSKNLIVEIKNSYLAKKYKNNIEMKKQSAIINGYNYIMIVDKNYSVFNDLMK